MKKRRKMMLLAGLFAVILLVSVNTGWAAHHGGGSHHHGRGHHHHGGGYHHHGGGYHHHGWRYYHYYAPVPVPVYPRYYRYEPAPRPLCSTLSLSVVNVLPVVEGKPYVMDVMYNGRLLYQDVLPGERRLLRMQSCASFRNQRMVTIDVKDSDGNFIGSVSRPFYLDSSRAEIWSITLSDIQQ